MVFVPLFNQTAAAGRNFNGPFIERDPSSGYLDITLYISQVAQNPTSLSTPSMHHPAAF